MSAARRRANPVNDPLLLRGYRGSLPRQWQRFRGASGWPAATAAGGVAGGAAAAVVSVRRR